MKQENIYGAIAVIALITALIAIGIVVLGSGDTPLAGVTYDPTRQPSLLPLKELSSSTDPVTGIIMDYQVINTTGATGSPYIGQIVMLSGNTWIKADPSSSMTGKFGVVVKAPTTNVSATGQVLIHGLVRNSSWSLTKGTEYYVSDTPGVLSSAKSNISVQPIGYAYNTTVLYFNPVVNITANTL